MAREFEDSISKIKEIQLNFYTEDEREKRISDENAKLLKAMTSLNKDKLVIVKPIIENISFCIVQMEELRKLISKAGYVEAYQNGKNQFGTKESIYNKQYINVAKIYNALLQRLNGFVPSLAPQKDDLDDFDKNN